MDTYIRRILLAFQQLKRNIENDVLKQGGLPITGPQMFLMNCLNRKGKCNLSYLAELMEVKPSAITVMIDRLEKPGYVKRFHDPSDRRGILVEMTEEGKKVFEKAVAMRIEMFKSYASRLSLQEIESLTALLEKMISPDGHEKGENA